MIVRFIITLMIAVAIVGNATISNLSPSTIDVSKIDCAKVGYSGPFCVLTNHSLIVLIAYQLILDFSFFPVLSTTDITEAYEVGNSRYAYTFFTVVAF